MKFMTEGSAEVGSFGITELRQAQPLTAEGAELLPHFMEG